MDDWQPFGLSAEEREAYEVLVPGVPDWMLEPVVRWAYLLLAANSTWANPEKCLMCTNVTRVPLGATAEAQLPGSQLRHTLKTLPDSELLRVIDYLLAVNYYTLGSPNAAALERVLKEARSKWRVGMRQQKVGLVERVPEGVRIAVEHVADATGTAGDVLARAWGSVHQLEPNDSAAYADAVKAVEIVATSVVQPSHSGATLGSVLGQMKADGDWRLPLREHTDAPGPEVVLANIRTLWFGHRDRHGNVNYSDVTHDEARAAVVLAACLVDWFASGALARRPNA
jgi:hypothetical protein